MASRILLMIMLGFITTPVSSVCAVTDTLGCGNKPISFECSFVRKQWFSGQCRIAQGRFFFDSRNKSACYDYSGPFRYRFIVNDTAVFGIDKKNNRGYVLTRSADPLQYDELYLSVHLFGQFLRTVIQIADQGADSVRGSVDSCVYFKKKTGSGSDIVAVSRVTGLPSLIESFDENGKLFEQSRMAYGADRKNCPALPSRLIVRKRSGDVVTSDTLAISAGKVTTTITPDMFGLPHECRLGALHDSQNGIAPFSKEGK
jgi:hypothetical protein